MIAIGVMVLAGIILIVQIVWTLRMVLRDDPGPRPTREDYDSRRPQ